MCDILGGGDRPPSSKIGGATKFGGGPPPKKKSLQIDGATANSPLFVNLLAASIGGGTPPHPEHLRR